MSDILLLSEIFPPEPGGSGRWFYESYRRIEPPECLFVVGNHEDAAAFDRENDQLTIERLDLHMPFRGIANKNSVIGYWQRFRQIRKLVKANRCKQIHAARPLFEGFVAKWVAATTGAKYLCYVHGEDVSVAKTSRELTMLTRSVLRSAHVLIANSDFTKTLLQQDWDIPESRIRTINPGVDTQYFQPSQRSEQVRNQLGWSDRHVVVTVGRLQARKGQDTLIKAIPTIKQSVPDVLYAIIGDGEERAQLMQLANSLDVQDHVRFHDEVSDEELLACYQQCDLFCLPNRQIGADVEGFGMVLLEAQSCGKPVIAGMSGGTAETMFQDKTGYVIDCTQPDGLANLVAELLLDKPRRETMGQHAQHFVRQRFDWQAVANQSSQLFHSIS